MNFQNSMGSAKGSWLTADWQLGGSWRRGAWATKCTCFRGVILGLTTETALKAPRLTRPNTCAQLIDLPTYIVDETPRQRKGKMIPPVDDSVLRNNPQFAELYTTLTTVILNPDGSTRKDPAAKKRAVVRKQLDEYRLQTAKETILINAISTADPKPIESKPAAPTLTRRTTRSQQQQQTLSSSQHSTTSDLPQPLLDLLLLLPPLLQPPSTTSLSTSETALLLSTPPLSQLPTHLPLLSSLISSSLHATALSLTRLALPATNPSFVHRSIPSLPTHISSLQDTIASRKATITKSRLALASSVSSLLSDQILLLTQFIKSLEAKHGPIARSLEYKATETSLEAQKQELEVRIQLQSVKREVYSSEVVDALSNYASHLRDAKGRLSEKIRGLKVELGEYEAGGQDKQRKMREMARVWREMSARVEDARGDLERLGGA
ncbi:hypothetical protein QBC44DRAFT_324747 [Cladorrhinum sp. PSN332]|nr:hypothetical protein QBC44DRAFT_324747 [Cladorrhinum sp. PSN332]